MRTEYKSAANDDAYIERVTLEVVSAHNRESLAGIVILGAFGVIFGSAIGFLVRG